MNNNIVSIKDRIRCSFNKAATSYDKSCILQKNVAIKLITILKEYRSSYFNIIDLGTGTGLITEMLANKFQYESFYGLDIANTPLIIAEKRLKDYRVELYVSDYDEIDKLNSEFDLVFSNMSLQWSLNLEKTFREINTSIATNGLFAFSIPLEDSLAELHNNSRNKFETQNSIKAILEKSNFKIIQSFKKKYKITYSSKLDALKSLKSVGSNCLIESSHSYLSGKGSLENIIQDSTLTYIIGFFICKTK